jgi:hypothetical protein
MIGATLLLLVATAGGSLATYVFDRGSPAYTRLAMGVFLGLTALSFAGFGLALFLGMGIVTLLLAAAITALPAVLLRRPEIRQAVRADLIAVRAGVASAVARPTVGHGLLVLYAAAIALGTWLVADKSFFETSEGLFIGNVNNLGDLPYHLGITTSFAFGDNFPPQNPVYAGSGFSYHYIADFTASVLVAAGASLVEAMLIMNVVLGLALLMLVHRWTRELTGSRAAARVAPLLLAFSGGLGWFRLFEEARAGEGGLVAAFAESDTRYTIDPPGLIQFGNAVTTLLIPQRGLLLGMGLAVIVFMILWRQLQPGPVERSWSGWRDRARDASRQPAMILGGVLTGLMPIVHMHTFAVVLGTAFFLGLLFREWRYGRWHAWAAYVVATLAVAAPVFAWTARGSQADFSAFFGLALGWHPEAGDPLTFWLINTGVFIPLVVGAYLWRGDRPLLPRSLLLYSLPFMLWFLIPNVMRLAPWWWDNIKVFVYWWLGAVPIVALVLVRLWDMRLAGRVAAVALAVVLTAAGTLDIGRATAGRTYQEFDPDGIAFAEMIRDRTPPGATILTAPSWNTPVFLTGRPVFMGYTGYLFANGLPYGEREVHIRAIYAGEPAAEELLRDNGISYIVVGPQEHRELEPNVEFLSRFEVAAEVGDYVLYDATTR